MISATTIQAVLAASITQVVASYADVKLDKAGKACCPFHGEKTPSFSVSEPKGIFKCFGCGVAGGVIEFVKRKELLDFPAAVEKIAAICNIPVEYEQHYDKEKYVRIKQEQASHREMMNAAHDKYRNLLWSDAGADAMNYLCVDRSYNKDIISYWQLGLAPNEWQFLTEQYRKEGMLAKAIALGLSKENDEKKSYDVFRNRIIFPILDANGELVSFGGRIFVKGDTAAKCINGPQSPLYDKSKTLFGLYQAIKWIRQYGYAIVVEGYTDVISMHAAGATNTVGTCGTALTPEQVILLSRYTNHIVLMRDGDKAGIKSTIAGIELMLPKGFRVDVMPMSEKQDPDDFAKQFFAHEEAIEEDTAVHT